MKFPKSVITDLESETEPAYGVITIELHYRDSKLHFYSINRGRSVIADDADKKAKSE